MFQTSELLGGAANSHRDGETNKANMPFHGYGQSDGACGECIPTKHCPAHIDRPVIPGHRNDGPVDLSKFGTPTGRGTWYFGRPRDFPTIEPLPPQSVKQEEAVLAFTRRTSQQAAAPPLERRRSNPDQSVSPLETNPKSTKDSSSPTRRTSQQATVSGPARIPSHPLKAGPGMPPVTTAAHDKAFQTTAQDRAALQAKIIAVKSHHPSLIGSEDVPEPTSREDGCKSSGEQPPVGWNAGTHMFSGFENRLQSLDGAEEEAATVADFSNGSSARSSTLVSSHRSSIDEGAGGMGKPAYTSDAEGNRRTPTKQDDESAVASVAASGPVLGPRMAAEYPPFF